MKLELQLRPDVLRWARERAGMSMPDLARKVSNITVTKVEEWEKTGVLSFAKAEKLAQVTHTPLGALYLTSPPEEHLPISDFRTRNNTGVEKPSPDLLQVIDDALRRQEWFRLNAIAEGSERLTFVGSMRDNEDVDRAASRIRDACRFDTEYRSLPGTYTDALNRMCDHFEELGVLVMRSGIVGHSTKRKLSVKEFRGFSLSDNYAPLIFINASDSKAAQMFTLAHELVHIWLGVSGVVDIKPFAKNMPPLETFCNSVAAEMLIPRAELKTFWRTVQSTPDAWKEVAKKYKVSSLVALIRLRELDLISESQFATNYASEEERYREWEKPKSSGGNFHDTEAVRTGRRFAKALIGSVLEGRTTYREAFQLFGFHKVETFKHFAKNIDLRS